MTVRGAADGTVPIGVALVGALALLTGWLVLLGADFIVGCGVMLVLAGAAVAMLTRHPDAR